MKPLLNTLFVTVQGAQLRRNREAVLVRVEKETRIHVPVHTLASIVCFGRVYCSPGVMELCAKAGVTISYLSRNGKFLSRIQGPVSGNVLLRRQQYRLADDESQCASIARDFLIGKIANARVNVMRSARETTNEATSASLRRSASLLSRSLRQLRNLDVLDVIRGKEGDAARVYFEVFDQMILAQKEGFFFKGRNRRPPTDNMNALLSFLYTLLVHDAASALESVGLDPAVGFLHKDRPGRPSLALDLMEELRPILADRIALTLVNRRQINAAGFQKGESGAVKMDDATRKALLVEYQTRKQDEILHPFLKEKIAIGLLPFVQALLLARYIRGDLNAYPPYVWR